MKYILYVTVLDKHSSIIIYNIVDMKLHKVGVNGSIFFLNTDDFYNLL